MALSEMRRDETRLNAKQGNANAKPVALVASRLTRLRAGLYSLNNNHLQSRPLVHDTKEEGPGNKRAMTGVRGKRGTERRQSFLVRHGRALAVLASDVSDDGESRALKVYQA